MMNINHNYATELEHQVRRLYKCERSGVSGLVEADYFEHNPIQAAVLVIAYLYANYMVSEPYEYNEFLYKYEKEFEYSTRDNIEEVTKEYVDELKRIVNEFID